MPQPRLLRRAEAADPALSAVLAESLASEAEPETHAGAVLRAIWPTVAGLFCSGTCGLLIFPFLTYVPSDGMLGELLPKVGQRHVFRGLVLLFCHRTCMLPVLISLCINSASARSMLPRSARAQCSYRIS